VADNQKLVIAFFDSEVAADQAAESLRSWEKASEEMKLGAIGVLVKDENGKVKDHKLGKREGKKGAGIGSILGLIAAVPTGGLSLVGGAVGGAVGGGVLGEFFHKGLKMSDEDATRINGELDAGHAAVGALAEWDMAELVSGQLKDLGGTPEVHEVTEEAQKAAAAAEQAK
jgi:hypothetical protein